MSSRDLAAVVFSTPELHQCLKPDLLWQLKLAQDITQDEVSATVAAGISARTSSAAMLQVLSTGKYRASFYHSSGASTALCNRAAL